MEQIILTPFADNKFLDLVDTLFEDEYFGFRSDAKEYVDRICAFIYSIPSQKRNTTKNAQYGAYYCQYKHNWKTAYYICFDMEDEHYIIRNILTTIAPTIPSLSSNMEI